MAKSCKGLAMELVKCLSESDCVKVENRPFRECAKEKTPVISSECVGLRETYFNCKRGQGTRLLGATEAAIVNSQTLEEVARLKQALKSGQVPADLNIWDAINATKSKDPIDNMVTDRENEPVTDGSKDANNQQKTDVPTDMEQE